MELYFVTATYTNNVYKLDDFFTGSAYKQVATKKLDLNFKADDGVTSIITPLVTPDSVDIRTYTHVIVPSQGKIYKIISADYHNTNQYFLTLDDDPLIANYQTLKDKNIIFNRTNDVVKFQGVNDVTELGFVKTQEIKNIQSAHKTGKWALLFFQYDDTKTRYGLKFKAKNPQQYETFLNFTALTAKYPQDDVTFEGPTRFDYFQKICYVSSEIQLYQCVYYYDSALETGNLRWVKYSAPSLSTYYFGNDAGLVSKITASDINTCVVALPFENGIETTGGDPLLHYDNFVGTTDPNFLIDIKIVDDLMLPIDTIDNTYSSVNKTMTKIITASDANFNLLFDAASGGAIISDYVITSFSQFETRIDVSLPVTNYDEPLQCEPFVNYELVVFGKRYKVPSYYVNNIKILIGLNSGIINYVIYYNNSPSYIIASGSFTHSAKWQVDRLDAFYSQNPTYKDQFYLKMATDSMKTITSGAIAGSVLPGVGTVTGAIAGFGASALDAGLAGINLMYQEKSLKLQADQIFGDNSELTMQLLYIFGIYWLRNIPISNSQMKVEYDLKGFPCNFKSTITARNAGANDLFGACKIVYGEIKEVVKNEYVTGYINNKLKGGVVII